MAKHAALHSETESGVFKEVQA